MTGFKHLMPAEFMNVVEEHAQAKSLNLEAKFVNDALYCGNKQNQHVKKRVWDMHEKVQKSDFKHAVIDMLDQEVVLAPSSELRKTCLDADNMDTIFSTMLECPEEEEEDFDEYFLRHLSAWVVIPVENSEFGWKHTCPMFRRYQMCKHMIKCGMGHGAIEKALELDSQVLNRNKKRGRAKGVGNKHTYDSE